MPLAMFRPMILYSNDRQRMLRHSRRALGYSSEYETTH